MTLLVTQLKNQDPMNPLDNAQLTSQLAQLSTVTGVNKLNTTLESLKASYQSSESLQAANMIGHGVLVEGNYVKLPGGNGILGVDLASAADKREGDHHRSEHRQGRRRPSTSAPRRPAPFRWCGTACRPDSDAAGKPV